MFKRFQKHYLAILLALLVGILTFAPQYIAIRNMGENFQGIYPVNNDDEIYYLVRAKDIVDGNNSLSNPYLYEHKNGDPMQFWLPDYILAKPLEWFNISVEKGFTGYDFILIFILTLLTYSIIFILTNDKIISLAGTTFLHIGQFLYFFDRPTSPQFIFIFWLLTLLFLIEYLKSKNKSYYLLTIISFGFLFHFYPYFWTFFVVLLSVFIFLSLFNDRKFNFKPYIYIIIGAVIIGIPYFISLFNSMNNQNYNESIYRLGMVDTHFPSGLKIVFISSFLLFVWFICYKKKLITINKISILLVAGLFATIICVNQHIITGKNLEFSSHYLPISIFWYVISSSYLTIKIISIDKFKKYKQKIGLIVLSIIIIYSAIEARQLFLKNSVPHKGEVEVQKYASLFDWLNEHTEKESVVYASQGISHLIPLYTANNIFYAREANLFFLSNEEVYERFIINNYYKDFTVEFILENERFLWGAHYRDENGHTSSKNKFRKILTLEPIKFDRVPDDKINEVLSLAEQIKSKTLEENLAKYRVDYLIFDNNNDFWLKEDLNFAELVSNDNGFFIYKVNK